MKIQVTGRHIKVTEAMKEFIEEKVESLCKFNHAIVKVHVVMEVQNLSHVSEIHLEGRNLRLFAKSTTKNMYNSISKSVDKISQQLKSHKFDAGGKNRRLATKTFEKRNREKAAKDLEKSA